MKKFLGIYFPVFISIGASGVFIFCYCLVSHKVALDCFTGAKCKTVSPAKKASIKIDKAEQTNVQIFEVDGRFYLVSDDYQLDGSTILIIDKAKNDVLLPNGGCHNVLFSKLFLKDCGFGGVPYSDGVKMNGFDTQVKISDSGINFVIPDHKIEILFKGE